MVSLKTYLKKKFYNKLKTLLGVPILIILTGKRRASLVLPVGFSQSWERG